jgi:hypothetical protein
MKSMGYTESGFKQCLRQPAGHYHAAEFVGCDCLRAKPHKYTHPALCQCRRCFLTDIAVYACLVTGLGALATIYLFWENLTALFR